MTTNPTITIDNVAFREAMWKLECTGRQGAIWCPDENRDCGLAYIDTDGSLQVFFSGPDVNVEEAVAWFKDCLLNWEEYCKREYS